MKKEIVSGIEYTRPNVFLISESGIGTAEIAARTCYDSFELSEDCAIRDFHKYKDSYNYKEIQNILDIDSSGLLHDLAWTHHHHSILEHINLTFYIEGTSRSVLQEHSRHRIQGISVRSTRYTMSDIINAFIACNTGITDYSAYDLFFDIINSLDMFVTSCTEYNNLEIRSIWDKLSFQMNRIGKEELLKISLSKENLEYINGIKNKDVIDVYETLRKGKKKRNVGDNFKHIVSDNWKVNLVCTFNLRSLKNYFDLRDSGAAYFQIKWLAEEMKKVTPDKYMKLIDKKFRNSEKNF